MISRRLTLAAIAATAALVLTGAARPVPVLTVMTFNVRWPNPDDGANIWSARRALFARTVAAADPDLIGTQELFKAQGDDIVRALPRYRWFGRDRRGGHGDEHMGIFYRPDRLTLLDHGDFWLSDTPDVPASISWGHPLPRMVNWGRFQTRDGRRFVALDTHFPYRDADEPAREKAAALIVARLPAIAGGDPVVLLGDFNTTPTTRTHAILTAALADARDAVPRPVGPAETFHDFTGKPDRRIDWILTRGVTPLTVETVTRHDGARYPSDHFPVVAKLRFAR
ncbi:endonuclease/exonuclease/phosphatase family metal-dependent hydrolase [Sphingomonas insulae]|uniref:Endonuclease/exonuclease/phosphatase family protein n=1 Tax=Sphingomonas insulae TaxID=424800 RepID=A0ABN1HKA5_9SPHN|nr:endonuclease/exonuclease/phosphatase family protein [Sphingomonas insulae]NIJ30453.1 endonuclease/exonuclease/phosphatase family metal-dependent hydrolase [Sphingomonas insulae]